MTTKYPPLNLDPNYTYLYQLFDKCGNLLYVGKANNPYARFRQHQSRSPWASQARSFTADKELRSEIFGLEQKIIKQYNPPWNIIHISEKVKQERIEAAKKIIEAEKKQARLESLAGLAGTLIGGAIGTYLARKTTAIIDADTERIKNVLEYRRSLTTKNSQGSGDSVRDGTSMASDQESLLENSYVL